MDIQKYNYIIAIAHHRSFSKAAKATFVSQPYLSRLVSELEESLGVHLFNREKKEITLTPAGEYYINYCKNIIMMEDTMKSELLCFSEHMKGKLRVGMSPTNGSYILPHAIHDFKQIYPNITVQVEDGNDQMMIENTINGSLDLLFLCVPNLPDQLDYQTIKMEPILLVLPPNHILENSLSKGNFTDPPYLNRTDFQALKNDPFISMSPNKGIGMYTNYLFEQFNFQPKTAYTLQNIVTAYQMATYGHGYTLIPQIVAKYTSVNEQPNFYQIDLDSHDILHRTHVAAYRKNKKLGPVERAFINCVRTYA